MRLIRTDTRASHPGQERRSPPEGRIHLRRLVFSPKLTLAVVRRTIHYRYQCGVHWFSFHNFLKKTRKIGAMSRCTAPSRGHHTASGRANCPACGGSSGRWGGGYSSYSSPSYSISASSSASASRSSGGSGGGAGGSARPRWSPVGSYVSYTPSEVRALTPFREALEKIGPKPDKRDIFLCHAWDDRATSAKELHDLLESRGVKVWFSEKDVLLGTPLMREIDKGLAQSRVGIVLVTPAFLTRIKNSGDRRKGAVGASGSGSTHSDHARHHLRTVIGC